MKRIIGFCRDITEDGQFNSRPTGRRFVLLAGFPARAVRKSRIPRSKILSLFAVAGVGLLPMAVQAHTYQHTYQERAVAAVLMGEAWSEGIRGMTAVADVIYQRAVEKHWTPLHVVSEHRGRVHAFSCVNGTSLNRLIEKFRGKRDYQKALRIAKTVCEKPDQLPRLVRAANHFTLATEHPYWARGKRPVAIVGKHAFYRIKGF